MHSRSIVRPLLAVATLGSVFAIAAAASADPRAQGGSAKPKDDCAETQGNGAPAPDTRYCFVSDPLAAGTEGPNSVLIPVRRIAAFSSLLRPRLHFVPELLRSAEQF